MVIYMAGHSIFHSVAQRSKFLLLLIFVLSPISSASALTLTVNSNGCEEDNNIGNGSCLTTSGTCTLNAAIQEANQASVAVTIEFQDSYSIAGCTLPWISGSNITIDGSSQWNYASNFPGVEIRGGGVNGSLLFSSSGDHAIYGIFFVGGPGIGIRINSSYGNNIIGGSGPGQRNVFLTQTGILIDGVDETIVSHNYFGTKIGKYTWLGDTAIVVGIVGIGPASISNNLIGGYETGISLDTNGNTIKSNQIGMQGVYRTETGIHVRSGQNEIFSNKIVENSGDGIFIDDVGTPDASNNKIYDNLFRDSAYSLGGNAGNGISIYGGHDNEVYDNQINGNGLNGIYAENTTNASIKGNFCDSNGANGIHFIGSSGSIGGYLEGDGNIIGTNQQNGIRLEKSSNVHIMGNLIGFDYEGVFDHGNLGHGILVDSESHNNSIGGTSSLETNWIGFNHGDGIQLSGINTKNNLVLGNIVGAPKNWAWEGSWVAPNGHHGISIYNASSDNEIGSFFGGGNSILANKWSGIAIVSSNNNRVVENKIGTGGNSNIDWGNSYYGINIVNSSGNTLHSNEIAYNGINNNQPGVQIDGVTSLENRLTQNSIHDNRGEGIKLMNGANISLKPPSVIVRGKEITGTTCQLCNVEIFSDYDNEGRFYEGNVYADNLGRFVWNGTLREKYVTATTTDNNRNTSEFSEEVLVDSSSIFVILKYILDSRNQ